MEEVYAVGIYCVQFVQEWFKDYGSYFELVNNVFNPYYALEMVFPMVSIVDSVFAAQLLLCLGFGGWLNSILKWILQEDRPYWWVRETSHYASAPRLEQTAQTCETGPGSPSGHCTLVAMVLVLGVMWISHVLNDRRVVCLWWRLLLYPVVFLALTSVVLARMFVAAHFPHQCLLGTFIGLFLAPFLCIYVSDPFIWGPASNAKRMTIINVICSLMTIALAVATYWLLKWNGVDPQWTVKLAFKWCASPEHIHFSTTPLYSLLQSCASLVGYSVAVEPGIARYRHYTKNRSLIISALGTYVFAYASRQFQDNINKDITWCFYTMQFVVYCIKPILFLKVTPWLAVYPFKVASKTKKD